MITAEEARQTTLSSKKGIEQVLFSIQAMAEGGYDFASFDSEMIIDPESVKSQLEDLGFSVNINTDSNHFKVTW